MVKLIVTLFLLSMYSVLPAQDTPYLERIITITFDQEPLGEALKKLAQKEGFTFSYNSSILDANKLVTYKFVNKTVREVLDQLLEGMVQYKVKGKYIILTKTKSRAKEKDDKVLSGYIIDEA